MAACAATPVAATRQPRPWRPAQPRHSHAAATPMAACTATPQPRRSHAHGGLRAPGLRDLRMASTRSHTREAAREDGQRAQPRASTRSHARAFVPNSTGRDPWPDSTGGVRRTSVEGGRVRTRGQRASPARLIWTCRPRPSAAADYGHTYARHMYSQPWPYTRAQPYARERARL
jgi:hypothetical protein